MSSLKDDGAPVGGGSMDYHSAGWIGGVGDPISGSMQVRVWVWV